MYSLVTTTWIILLELKAFNEMSAGVVDTALCIFMDLDDFYQKV